jgi:membrane protein involved in D-alanine export
LPPEQYLAYLFFFPTVSSGPIDRYRRFADDWKRRHSRADLIGDLDGAVQHVFRGFLYKFLLAALVKKYWLDPAEHGTGLADTLAYMYAYTFYLFFDFAGYSAFAVGLSYVFGVHTPENFDRPFLARNIRDFWNRWHISLSWWFRDHVYMRFVMAATKRRWFKGRYTASSLAFFLSFGLMGLWHGTAPHYLLYGCYHASLLAGFDAFSRWNKKHHLWGDGLGWRVASTILTFHVVCFGFLLFSGHIGPNFPAAARPAPEYEGSQDQTDGEEISGWVWDRTRPDEPLRVDLYDGESVLATVLADQSRPDLIRSGKGNAKHSFVYVVPARLKDGLPHAIRATVAGTQWDLANTPQIIMNAELVSTVDGREGVVNEATCEQVAGWAWDSAQPDAPVGVDIYEGDTLLATVPADLFRPGLRDAGKGNGKHGFAYRVPASLKDGQPHPLRLRISGTNIDLKNTPKLILCPP